MSRGLTAEELFSHLNQELHFVPEDDAARLWSQITGTGETRYNNEIEREKRESEYWSDMQELHKLISSSTRGDRERQKITDLLERLLKSTEALYGGMTRWEYELIDEFDGLFHNLFRVARKRQLHAGDFDSILSMAQVRPRTRLFYIERLKRAESFQLWTNNWLREGKISRPFRQTNRGAGPNR